MRSDGERLLLGFGAASLGAVALGALVCALSGVPAGVWVRNLVAWGLGALLALSLSRLDVRRWLKWLPWVAGLALTATFLARGQEGVHRWIALGPLNINVAMLVLPAAVVAVAGAERRTVSAWAAAFLCLALLIAQPDASQATALGASLAVVALAAGPPGRRRWALAVAALAGAAAAWLRPDPLAPVPEVEDILELAAAQSVILSGLALLLLAVAPAALTPLRLPAARRAGLALGACLALWTAATFFGAYPVPLVGVGLSPVLGAWLGVGVLAALSRP